MAALLRTVPGAKIRQVRKREGADSRGRPKVLEPAHIRVLAPEVHKDDWNVWRLEPDLYRLSRKEPVQIGEHRGRIYWLFKDQLYSTGDQRLTPDDVLALANQAENQRRLALEKAHALQTMTTHLDTHARRERIPQEAKVAVWQRDQGRCVECQRQTELEFDHIIPLAMGGSNSIRNLQLLCGPCNRRKGATLG